MAFELRPVYFDGMDIIVDERGSQFITMRKTQWVEDDKDPEPEKAKYELRKYIIDKDGNEKPGKGVSFLTPEGPHNLVKELVAAGFGDTKEVLIALRGRENFRESVEHLFDPEEAASGEYFDMRTVLLAEDPNAEVSDE